MKAEQAPKTWKDIINPAFKDGISAKLATSGMQHAQWYILRKMYGNDFWQEFAKQRPKGFDARAQLFDRLAKGDDRICALAEYAGYTLYQEKGAEIDFVAPAEGLPAIAIYIGVVNKAPHPEAAKLFVDWAMSKRGQAVYQNQKILLYGSLRPDAGPMPTGKRLADFKLLFPTDSNDYVASHPVFVKEWNAIMGLVSAPASPGADELAGAGPVLDGPGPRLVSVLVGGAAAMLVLYPIAYLIQASLSVGDPQARPPEAYGLDNFTGLGRYAHIFGNTLLVAAMATVYGGRLRLHDGLDPLAHERARPRRVRAAHGAAVLRDPAHGRARLGAHRLAEQRLRQPGLARSRRRRRT